ncbi:type II toxin-antitoxin system PemK/MazF family toxin [Aggregatibacter actinomycetemcomitans]|nr:type II toxin-antitoxin system PemK/MazF family toxin [Aggregatibacter actinomycetemcomitans]EHK90206.1 hypothetical protein RHAA1_05503 [Aggregatibacter actinomycetemcomitans RhAA1]KNE77279.1 growth inhibitor PemK [Aggregatibacter actinomycetemcomitans RhAA1]MBN6074557.1 type II toxin-antitoxin system PemK/MazF family toxin [Aggregatibacter actinomycetemcomitans]MBN6077310.1 type II toxin-antitoxin system PemK/MazF family toxin [Aggregatibacter actinomycetemcomitans]
MYIPERGDIVRICLNPVVGNEIQGEQRPVLVISPKRFNQYGLILVCPITQGEASIFRKGGFYVSLMGYGLDTLGGVVANQSRILDWRNRAIKKVETAPIELVQEVQDIITAIVND